MKYSALLGIVILMCMHNHIYRIVLNSRPGVYSLPEVLDPALIRDRRLIETGVKINLKKLLCWAVIRVLSMAGEPSYFSKESVNCVLRGHHVYKHIWTPGIGEELSRTRQSP